MGLLCWLGCYEQMEKESNSFLILTLMTTSKWSHKQALGSAEVPKGKTTGDKVPLSPLLLGSKKCISTGSHGKLPSKPAAEAGWWVLHMECSVQSPLRSPEGAKQLVTATLLAGRKLVQLSTFLCHAWIFLFRHQNPLSVRKTQRALLLGTYIFMLFLATR